MLATKTICSYVNELSISVGWGLDLTIAHQNLAGKERENFTISLECIVTQAGFGSCSTICLATHLNKFVLYTESFANNAILIFCNL